MKQSHITFLALLLCFLCSSCASTTAQDHSENESGTSSFVSSEYEIPWDSLPEYQGFSFLYEGEDSAVLYDWERFYKISCPMNKGLQFKFDNSPAVYGPGPGEFSARTHEIYFPYDGDSTNSNVVRLISLERNIDMPRWGNDQQTVLLPDRSNGKDGFVRIYHMIEKDGRVFLQFIPHMGMFIMEADFSKAAFEHEKDTLIEIMYSFESSLFSEVEDPVIRAYYDQYRSA